MRTIQAVRQVIYAALTSPQLVYTVNDGDPVTLPVVNVSARPVWTPAVGGGTQPPDPYVAFSVGGGSPDAFQNERKLRMQIWVSSNSATVSPDDECTELYEAIRLVLHCADDEPHDDGFPKPSLSRTATATTLGVQIRRCREMSPGAFPADYEPKSARWYVSAHYEIVAL